MTSTPPFDPSRALLRSPDYFQRFRTEHARQVPASRLPAQTPLLVFERGGESRGLLTHQMVYHHVAQGELKGIPYLVSF